ncbi:MAG: hypothetical protein A2Z17_07165 [Gammaproteobacteria bacterium RBG_16_66_13]|nr:MAG: hypothetical protein A2Z17_07165 [Gammaproteobacteria bacterium RBG_16_66_13]
MQRVFQQSYHVPGTLAANVVIKFTAPMDMQLVHAQAVASNASSATIIIGPSTDTDGYLVESSVGDSSVPAEFDKDDFVNTEFPHIVDGTIVVVTVDYDGASGTAAADLTVVLTFTEG